MNVVDKRSSELELVTKAFLTEFDKAWIETLSSLNCNQKQLILGSRLRPQIALWGYLANREDLNIESYETIAQTAVSVELIHKASLLIDDWIDGDFARHGAKAFHIAYSPEYAVVVAIHMVSKAMCRLKSDLPRDVIPPTCYYKCIDIIADTVHSMSLGLIKELELSHQELFDIRRIKEIAYLETAEILGNAMLLGYYVGGGMNQQVAVIIKSIGDQCGYLFQTMNDLEAFCNKQGNMSHKGSVNYDIDMHRKNMAIARLFDFASTKEREQMLTCSGDDLHLLMKRHKIVEIMLRDMELVYKQIIKSINVMSQYGIGNHWIDSFTGFIDTLKNFAEHRLDKS